MISAGDFRNGMTFEMDGSVFSVLEFQHVKPGKGAAFVRAKIKNVVTGSVIERTFNPSDKFQTAFIERKEMQYLYNNDDVYYFMDNKTYEQLPVDKKILGDSFRFAKENMFCKVASYKNSVFSVEPPFFVKLKIIKTDPGFKGNTATNATKPAELETGAVIQVPLFINEGETIKIDTRSGEYMERA
ncbi:MAG: elongation factor P [Oscillospiraceae bacterium]|jgi:elongation factor P|nr:elongation factor P [Oscillospiraceae bacterium]